MNSLTHGAFDLFSLEKVPVKGYNFEGLYGREGKENEAVFLDGFSHLVLQNKRLGQERPKFLTTSTPL